MTITNKPLTYFTIEIRDINNDDFTITTIGVRDNKDITASGYPKERDILWIWKDVNMKQNLYLVLKKDILVKKQPNCFIFRLQVNSVKYYGRENMPQGFKRHIKCYYYPKKLPNDFKGKISYITDEKGVKRWITEKN